MQPFSSHPHQVHCPAAHTTHNFCQIQVSQHLHTTCIRRLYRLHSALHETCPRPQQHQASRYPQADICSDNLLSLPESYLFLAFRSPPWLWHVLPHQSCLHHGYRPLHRPSWLGPPLFAPPLYPHLSCSPSRDNVYHHS